MPLASRRCDVPALLDPACTIEQTIRADSEAPPTRAPSMSASAIRAADVVRLDAAAVQDAHAPPPPPARARRCGVRMKRCTSCACAGVALRPVPIAHTGSYAITTRCQRPRRRCRRAPRRAAPHAAERLARVALGQRLADADDRREARASAARAFRLTRRVRLAEQLAPLAVADDDVLAARVGQLRRRHLAGERAFVLPEAVLRGDRDRAVLEPLRDRVQRREAGRDGDVDVAQVATPLRTSVASASDSAIVPLSFQLPQKKGVGVRWPCVSLSKSPAPRGPAASCPRGTRATRRRRSRCA